MIPKLIANSGEVEYKYSVGVEYAEDSNALDNSKSYVYIIPSGEELQGVINYLTQAKLPSQAKITSVECEMRSLKSVINNKNLIVNGYIYQKIYYNITGSTSRRRITSNVPFSIDFQQIQGDIDEFLGSVEEVIYTVRSSNQVDIIIKAKFNIKYV